MIFTQRQSNQQIRPERKIVVDQNSNQNQHYVVNMRKKYKKSRDRKVTHSVCSIDGKRSSNNISQQPIQIKRRKLLSIPSLDGRNIQTQRNFVCEKFCKKQDQNITIIPQQYTKLSRKIKTQQQNQLQIKEKKIKNCIQLMQGVLKEIQQQKIFHSNKRVKIIDEFDNKETINQPKIYKQEQKELKLQQFIKKIPPKQDTKAILLKKVKQRSLISICDQEREMPVERLIKMSKQNKQNFDIGLKNIKSNVKDKDKQLLKQQNFLNKKSSNKQIIKDIIQSFDCSTILNVNQSSFISQSGKKQLIKKLNVQNRVQEARDKVTIQIGKKYLKISNKKIKDNFPNDFF